MKRLGSINDKKQSLDTFDGTAFRSAMTSREGHVPGRLVGGRIIGINLVNWTVDVASNFDRMRWLGIQVSSPYLHYSNGEGIYVVPEVGASCMVCLPSDSSPPYVSCFVMPVEKITDSSSTDAPQGTQGGHGSVMKHATAARFDGGRPPAVPGDIIMRGRDNNFVILHRGGVLQIGSTELAQRIFIPLDNHVMDVSERYSHMNVGGSILWGLAEGKTDYSVKNIETYRVFANDQYADIRISKGFVEPVTPTQSLPDQAIYEVVITPKGINTYSGDLADGVSASSVVYQFLVDRGGNISMTIAGDVFHTYKKTLTVHTSNTMKFTSDADMSLSAQTGMDLSGGQYVKIDGSVVRINGGTLGVARMTDPVQVPSLETLPAPVAVNLICASVPVPGVATPATIQFITPMLGVVLQGSTTVFSG